MDIIQNYFSLPLYIFVWISLYKQKVQAESIFMKRENEDNITLDNEEFDILKVMYGC